MFQGSISLIRYRVGALATGIFTGVAEATPSAAVAPGAIDRVTGQGNCGERGWVS